MKQFLSVMTLCLSLTAPALAEDAPPAPEGDIDEGMSLLERGAELVLRGFLKEVEPELQEMQKGLDEAARELGPALGELMALFDDFRNYDAPERLPNGDIIIRRRPDAPPPAQLPSGSPDADGAIEL